MTVIKYHRTGMEYVVKKYPHFGYPYAEFFSVISAGSNRGIALVLERSRMGVPAARFRHSKISFAHPVFTSEAEQDSSLVWRELDYLQQRMDAPYTENTVGRSGIGGFELSRMVSGCQQSSDLG
jgi:hypothetical protein